MGAFVNAGPNVTVGTSRRCKLTDKMSFERICTLLGVKTTEQWDEHNADSFLYRGADAAEMSEEEIMCCEADASSEAWQSYKSAVLLVAEEVFARHALTLVTDEHERTFRVVPSNSWRIAADNIRMTINGVGQFEFSSLQEFLSSGPYTPRQAVLSHLGWIPSWYEVYEGGKASSRVERRMR